jgi:uncharacterized LabA/DUF88 family protein
VPNFAFIDGQNLHLGTAELGWTPNWRRFRIYLEEHYHVSHTYYFIGYILVFKEVTYRGDGKPKGNVDAELVLQAMIEYPEYDRAVVATSDGDFACLVRYLYEQGKLERVLRPHRKTCSALLKRAAHEWIDFLEDARRKIN